MNSSGKLIGESAAVNKPEEVLSLHEVFAHRTGESRWVKHAVTLREVRAEMPCKGISSLGKNPLVCH